MGTGGLDVSVRGVEVGGGLVNTGQLSESVYPASFRRVTGLQTPTIYKRAYIQMEISDIYSAKTSKLGLQTFSCIDFAA